MTFDLDTHLDGLDQVGCAVGNVLGTLYKVSLSDRIGGLAGGQATGVTQGRRVLSNHCCC